jgi:hypothetical protein
MIVIKRRIPINMKQGIILFTSFNWTPALIKDFGKIVFAFLPKNALTNPKKLAELFKWEAKKPSKTPFYKAKNPM